MGFGKVHNKTFIKINRCSNIKMAKQDDSKLFGILGIALTLIGIVLLFLFFKEKAQKQLDSVNKKFNTNLIAAFLIITIGVLYLLMNLLGTGHQH